MVAGIRGDDWGLVVTLNLMGADDNDRPEMDKPLAEIKHSFTSSNWFDQGQEGAGNQQVQGAGNQQVESGGAEADERRRSISRDDADRRPKLVVAAF